MSYLERLEPSSLETQGQLRQAGSSHAKRETEAGEESLLLIPAVLEDAGNGLALGLWLFLLTIIPFGPPMVKWVALCSGSQGWGQSEKVAQGPSLEPLSPRPWRL